MKSCLAGSLLVVLATALCVLPSCTCSDPGHRRGTDGGPTPPPGTDGSGPFRCTPGAGGCAGNTYYVCGPDGTSQTNPVACDSACDPGLRCVLCRPGGRRCEGTVSMFCAADGLSWVSGRDCSEWSTACGADGFCADACADAERSASNVGCEYWPVPLANTGELNPALFDFRVVVANPNDAAAHVRVTRSGADVYTGNVAPHGLSEIVLPWIDGQSFAVPQGAWRSLVVAGGAYRLTSDLPVIATQFNPFEYVAADGTPSYTNDASLLFPVHVLTGDYVGMSWYPLSRRTGTTGGLGGSSWGSIRYPGYVAIVGVSPEPTRVQIEARGAIVGDATGRFPDTRLGGSLVFTIARGEVVHVMAAVPPECGPGRPGFVETRDCMSIPFLGETCDIFQTCQENEYDLTGSRITADHPIAVFGGHVCAYVPTSAQACDHMEIQLPPIQAWGREFTSAPMGDGSTNGTNVLRVVAAFDATDVRIEPPQGGVSGGTLARGDFLDLEATTPFHVSGSGAVLVAQYLRGQHSTTPAAARGDPALTVLVPAEQFRSDYTFILPSSYNPGTNGQNHLLVVRPPGLPLTLDGAPVTATFSAIAGSEVGVVLLDGGTHSIQAAMPFGVTAYGLGSFTSYATPAGLNLAPITIVY